MIRLVEETNNISPSGTKFTPTNTQIARILDAPKRAVSFVGSNEIQILKSELDEKVNRFKNEILVAGLIENVNVRGRLIAGEDEKLRQEIVNALLKHSNDVPQFKTENALGDYSREFPEYSTETDIKTKVMVLDSNPKAYNLDKVLEFLATDRSVLMFYFVGIEPAKIVNTVLVSIFQQDPTLLLKHWAGRNSEVLANLREKAISRLIRSPNPHIDNNKATSFLRKILAL